MKPPPTIADIAAAYNARGFKPLPLVRGGKSDKRKAWQKQPYDPRQFNGNAQNIGLQMGEVSRGLTDIDLDCAEAIRLAPFFLPATPAVFGRNSKPYSHWLYITELWRTEPKAVVPFEDHGTVVELRCGGGGKGALSVVPPSMHVTGERVAWANGGTGAEPARTDCAGLKRAVMHLAIASVLTRYYPADGLRHKGALALGGALVRAGWNESDISYLVETVARDRLDDDVSDRITAAVSALKLKADGGELPGLPRVKELWGDDAAKFLGKWIGLRDKAHGEGAESDNPFTEDALALRFSERHKDDLRYIATKGAWLKWDGTRWYAEATHLAFDLARQSCRDDAQTFGNGKAPATVYAAKTIAAVERMAKADRRQATTVEQWDAEDFAFNVELATFNLLTGDSYVPRPSDYITKKAICHCAPQGTPHPVWTAFLERVAPDTELRAFLQRFIGYSLTGATSEHKFVFAYGTGANGKGTFINTIAAILDDYATVADVGTFIASNTERHPTDVAKLHGYRLVVAQETEKGRRWDETKIKSMTGGDRMTARFMRQDFFDFIPKFKLWIVGNHKPRLDNVDEAMRRRMLLVPFTVQIPKEERDTELPEKIKAEWPAILRWALDGCLEWQRIGIAPPKIVTEATDEYFEDQDTTKQWLEDCSTDAGPYAFTPTSQLFSSWREWCVERNLHPGTGNAFSDALVDRGYARKKGTGGVRGFRSLALKTASTAYPSGT